MDLIKLIDHEVLLSDGVLREAQGFPSQMDKETCRKATMTYGILTAHNMSGDFNNLKIKFDVLASHETTYMGIIQAARASGLEEFPVPYVMTNCHNSLCAEGGTINEDDHVFGYSSAKKYGGIFVPMNQAILHQYMREMMVAGGRLIMGSDSHTRYGAFGTMGIGEGGPELVKQLLNHTYNIPYPKVIAVYITGTVKNGVGPQDVALAIIGATFSNGFVNNAVMEFIGDGIHGLSAEFRHGVDVMTTETTCLSTIWETDEIIRKYYKIHGREGDYKKISPLDGVLYDGAIIVDLSKINPMIALPFHPSIVFTIDEFNENAEDIMRSLEVKYASQINTLDIKVSLADKLLNGQLRVPQGIIAGCSGGSFENISAAAAILRGANANLNYFALNIYPASTPITHALIKNGAIEALVDAGVIMKTAFCGPCFGAGDVPANNVLSIRHVTRNFPNREGSKPNKGQIAYVALMDARSIASTARNGGHLTSAAKDGIPDHDVTYNFNKKIYEHCVFNGYGKADRTTRLIFGPNITDWPEMIPLTDNLLLRMASVIHDPVTTTDELIPSGDHNSYRSNPQMMAEFTLYRRDPPYRKHAKAIYAAELARRAGKNIPEDIIRALSLLSRDRATLRDTSFGSVLFAVRPGDGSAREYASSCQRVLGGSANIAHSYATQRYRSNLINWGILPFLFDGEFALSREDFIYLPDIRKTLFEKRDAITAYTLNGEGKKGTILLHFGGLTDEEREVLLSGSLIGYYKLQNAK
jgi:aconitate hydratase